MAYMLKYDSTHAVLRTVDVKDGHSWSMEKIIRVTAEKDRLI